jgi:hypothetical protein
MGYPITLNPGSAKIHVSACGLLCELCPKFLKKQCSGCAPNPVCEFPQCAADKGVSICFECDEFPCEKSYRFFPKSWLDFIKSDEIVG